MTFCPTGQEETVRSWTTDSPVAVLVHLLFHTHDLESSEPAVLLQKCWLESACNSFTTTKMQLHKCCKQSVPQPLCSHQPIWIATTMTCCLQGTQCHHSFSEEMVQQQGWEGRTSSKSSSCNFGSFDWMVIGIGTQQVNVGFDNTLPTVESITKSFSANCGKTCKGLPCFCNFMKVQTSLSNPVARELWKSWSILADVLVILVHAGLQGFEAWLTVTWWLSRGKSEHLLDTWRRSDSFSWWNLLFWCINLHFKGQSGVLGFWASWNFLETQWIESCKHFLNSFLDLEIDQWELN